MKQALVSVAILTLNREKELRRALDSVLAQDYENYEIIVFDNGSSDNTRHMMLNEYSHCEFIESEINHGCPLGRNLLVGHCKGEFILFLDDDAWMGNPKTIKILVNTFEDLGEMTAVVMPNIREHRSYDVYNRYPSEGVYELFSFSGGVSLIAKTLFNKYGPFPDTKYGSEEKYLAIRFFEAGYKIFINSSILIDHQPSQHRDIREIVRSSARNDVLFIRTFAPLLLIPFLGLWKIIIWTRFGLRKHAVAQGLYGVLEGLVMKLEKNYSGSRISWRTYLKFMANKRVTLKKSRFD